MVAHLPVLGSQHSSTVNRTQKGANHLPFKTEKLISV